jgi:hypothetical protein
MGRRADTQKLGRDSGYRAQTPVSFLYVCGMDFKKIDDKDLAFFRSVIGDEYVVTSADGLARYSKDETEDLRFPPEVVIKPATTDEYQPHHGILL